MKFRFGIRLNFRSLLLLIIFVFAIVNTDLVYINAQNKKVEKTKQSTENKEFSQIKELFNKYKYAIADKRDADALNCISQNSLAYYNDILKKSIYIHKDSLQKEAFLNKLMILSIRHNMSLKEMKKLDAKSLFKKGVKLGWFSSSIIKDFTLGDFTKLGDAAFSRAKYNNKLTDYIFRFENENNKWKIDISSIISSTEEALRIMLKKSKMNENEYIEKLIEDLSGSKPRKILWEKAV